MSRVIVTVSGGKASAWCADWAIREYGHENVILYFNDTKWEHPDLYRFLDDLSAVLQHEIIHDNDGRSPEELAYDEHALPCNRMPFCSRILKAERLQAFYQDGDTIVFGISNEERHRADRLVGVYQYVGAKTGKWAHLKFPLIQNNVTKAQVEEFITSNGIVIPLLYRLGFTHNNCSGGCVRASSKKHWKLLLHQLPEVYAERERLEREFNEHFGTDYSILKDTTLERLRLADSMQMTFDFEPEDEKEFECIGICQSMA